MDSTDHVFDWILESEATSAVDDGAAERIERRPADDVLRGDQLDTGPLAIGFRGERGAHLGVARREVTPEVVGGSQLDARPPCRSFVAVAREGRRNSRSPRM